MNTKQTYFYIGNIILFLVTIFYRLNIFTNIFNSIFISKGVFLNIIISLFILLNYIYYDKSELKIITKITLFLFLLSVLTVLI